MDGKLIEIINDGQVVTQDFMERWEIQSYCKHYNNSIIISFVGVVIKKESILMSFPKHYEASYNLYENVNNMKKISRLISLNNVGVSSFSGEDRIEFPINAYLSVVSYYKKYGLYSANHKYYEASKSGKINWKKTIDRSNKITQTNGILFFPFITEKNKNMNVFLSECMNYVLSDALRFKDYLSFVVPYKKTPVNKLFDNTKQVLKKLAALGTRYFKDEEKRLIHGIVEYISWKASSSQKFKIITLDFELYWEKMVHYYLREHFYQYKNDQIIWKNNQNRNFEKISGLHVESKIIREAKKIEAMEVEAIK